MRPAHGRLPGRVQLARLRLLDGRGIASQVQQVGNAQGLAILGNEGLESSPANVRAAAARIKASGGLLLLRRLRLPGRRVLRHRELGSTLARTAYPPRGQRLFRDFKACYGRYPEPFAIYGYEAMSVVLSSIRQADRPSTTARGRRAIIDAFFAQRGRRSVLGTYDIDRFGDTTLPDSR